MALTERQNIPTKKETSEPWTFKRLLGFGATSQLTKLFVSPLEVLLGYVVFVIGLAVIIGKDVPVLIYGLSACLLGVVAYERFTKKLEVKSKVKETKK